MLLGNKVRAGSSFTPRFAVPCRALAVPVAVEGWGSVGALPAGWVQPAYTLRGTLLLSGLSRAPEVTPEVFGGSGGGVVSPAASGGQHEAEAPSMGCSRYWMLVGTGCCWVWDDHPGPGCTPRSQVTPSPRCPTRTHILSRGPRCC